MIQITSITNESGIITTDLMDVKRIINKYSEQLYVHKFDNLDEMERFFERHNLPKLTQEEIDNPNRPISIKEIESIINTFQNRKHQAHMGSLVNSTKF